MHARFQIFQPLLKLLVLFFYLDNLSFILSLKLGQVSLKSLEFSLVPAKPFVKFSIFRGKTFTLFLRIT